MSSAKEALERLKSGNRRFTSGQRTDGLFDEKRRAELTQGQAPFAVVLGCSDSRVPVEYVFDQGGGDLFVIRVAGNLVEETQMGSVEFAVTVLGSRLVVVLGHTECGAIKTTLNVMSNPAQDLTPGLSSLVDAIRPAISPVAESLLFSDEGTVMSQSIRKNVAYNVDKLKTESPLLIPLCESGELLIVGAEYDLKSGEVDFFYGE
ncbi:MAG: carbonic anhydrase [Gammaproteobacteria bacterium]|nr:carbonic anhydrase [Gammaproteobacteria bacterium]MCY4227974.1 carbonic anhydrase [Gammaproteobacteria bacterium]MCY4312783.1 carbonic anhydrase [Gammaproteobacteria bacterium]